MPARLAVSFLIATCLWAASEPFSRSCTVTAVSDGDTLAALCAGIPQRIRISSVDAPESGQPYGPEAKAFTADMALQQTVAVFVEDYDRYDRMVARVVLPAGAISAASWYGQAWPGTT